MKLKDPATKTSKPSNELMLNSNSIHYTCPKCNVLFNGVPTSECKFCDHKFNLRTLHEKNGSKPQEHPLSDMDYCIWSETDGHIHRI